MMKDNTEILQLIYGQIQLLRAEVALSLEKRDEHLGQIDIKCTNFDERIKNLEKQCNDCPGKKALEKVNAQDSKEWKIGNLLIIVGASTAIILSILGLIALLNN